MNSKAIINALLDLEASADLTIMNAQKVKKIAREERLKLTGSSLPVVRKGLDEKHIAQLLAGRMKTLLKKKKS